VIIAYVESPTEAPGPVFSEVAEAHRDSYLFGLTSDPAAISQAGVKTPTIVIYKKFDEGRFDITGAAALTVESLSASIKAWSTPLFDEVNGDNYSKYAESGLPLAYLFIDPTDEKRVELIQSLTPIAQAQKGNINFVWIDSTKYVEHAKGLALEPQFPAFVIQDLTSQNKYPLSQDKEVTFELVAPFIGEFLDGKLQPKLKSEPVPETQDEPVYNLVGSKFEEIIFDDSKDVFIEFYAHW
jgi:protein disulfide-isomerase A1